MIKIEDLKDEEFVFIEQKNEKKQFITSKEFKKYWNKSNLGSQYRAYRLREEYAKIKIEQIIRHIEGFEISIADDKHKFLNSGWSNFLLEDMGIDNINLINNLIEEELKKRPIYFLDEEIIK